MAFSTGGYPNDDETNSAPILKAQRLHIEDESGGIRDNDGLPPSHNFNKATKSAWAASQSAEQGGDEFPDFNKATKGARPISRLQSATISTTCSRYDGLNARFTA